MMGIMKQVEMEPSKIPVVGQVSLSHFIFRIIQISVKGPPINKGFGGPRPPFFNPRGGMRGGMRGGAPGMRMPFSPRGMRPGFRGRGGMRPGYTNFN